MSILLACITLNFLQIYVRYYTVASPFLKNLDIPLNFKVIVKVIFVYINFLKLDKTFECTSFKKKLLENKKFDNLICT